MSWNSINRVSGKIYLLLCFLPLLSNAGSPGKTDHPGMGKNAGFIENKGQVIDQDHKLSSQVLYLLNSPGMNVQLRRGGFSYDLYRILNIEQRNSNFDPGVPPNTRENKIPEVQIHRIDFDLVGANPDCQISASSPSAGYSNYYTTGTPVEGITYVHAYGCVTYKNIYPNIDIEFNASNKSGFKYNIVVWPGGDIASVKLKITDPEIYLTSAGALMLKNSAGSVREEIPVSYTESPSGMQQINVSYRQLGPDMFGFKLNEAVPVNSKLIVDPVPVRLWGTYFGGDGDLDILSDLKYTPGSPEVAWIACGETNSMNNIASSGAHQTVFGGNQDALLVKFDAGGMRIWATYYGGSGLEYAGAVAPDNQGGAYFCGSTGSDNNIATPGCHQFLKGSLNTDDAFLARFNTNGIRLWGTYYGGSDQETGYDCASDPGGGTDVYMVGFTNSPNQVATPGSYQPNMGGGTDAYLVRFDDAGVRQWATYYGKGLLDVAMSVEIAWDGNIIFGGETANLMGITSDGAYQTVYGGGLTDAFLVAMNAGGQRQWATYYGGNGWECIEQIDVNPNGQIAFTGYTKSIDRIASPGAFQPLCGGGTDAMAVLFNSDGTRQWGTYYGGAGTDYGLGCSLHNNGNVFFSGYTESGSAIASPDGYQLGLQGTETNGMLFKLDPLGQRLWGTYYGGDGRTEMNFVNAKSDEYIWVGGQTYSTFNMATPGSWQTSINGACDGFLAKFKDCSYPDQPGPISGPTDICTPASGVVYNVSAVPGATSYIWNVPAGTTILWGQNTNVITVDFSNSAVSGAISVMATNDCSYSGITSLDVNIHQRPVPTIGGYATSILGTTYTYATEPGMGNYQWNKSSGGTLISGGGVNDDFIQIQWSVADSQWITVNYANPAGCSALSVTQKDIVVTTSTVIIDFTAPDTVCVGGNVSITNLSQGAATYYWNFCSGSANTNPTGVNIGNPGSLLNIPTYITLVKEGVNCYSFISCQGVGVIRYFHGTSFANNPITWTNLGQFGLINFNEEGIQVKYDNGNWYGFVNSYTTIIRLNFGNSLANTPTATDIGPFPSFNMPHGLVITREGTTWLGFVTCSIGQSLHRLNFGASLANIPVLTDFGSLGGVLIQPFSICLLEENAVWYAMIMASGTTLARITFGASLLNTPTGVNLGNPGGFNAALGLTFLRDCESTTGYWTNYLPNGQLGKLTFPTGITGSVTGTVLGNIGGLARPSLFSELFRENDNLYAYICNRDNGTLTRLTFPPCTNASIPSSTLFNPPTFSYNQPGTYNIHLILDEGLSTMASLCKPVVVVQPPVLNLGNDRSICPGGSTTLDAGALFSNYQWSNGATTQTITVSAAGTYSVTATRWGCTAGDELVVSILSTPTIDLGQDVTICAGQTQTFDAGFCAGCIYQWDNLTTGQTNIGTGQTYTTGNAGEYMVTVIVANGCVGSDIVRLFVDPLVPVSISITSSSASVCEGSTVNYTAFASMGGNSPLFQWKVNGLNQGMNSALFSWIPLNGDCITCTLSSSYACTTGNPATSNQLCMTVTQALEISVAITPSANPVCAGTTVTYTAVSLNGGVSPAYQWKVNGLDVGGATSSTYSFIPLNGNTVECTVSSSEACITGSPATSNIITMTVDPLLPVSLVVAASANPVCGGTLVVFTTFPVNAGISPSYQWKVNGVNVPGATDASWSDVPANGSMISCVLTSGETCAMGSPATSNTVVMTVDPLLPVSLVVTATANPVCSGTLVTFTATPENAGTSPAYLWSLNGINIPGATNPTYSVMPVNGNIVQCVLTSRETCTTGNPATSNPMVMTVISMLPVSLSILASANPVCTGTSVTFTATPTNGGTSPAYQWMVNGVGAGSNAAFFDYIPVSGDQVSCLLSSSLGCVSNNPAPSGIIVLNTWPLPDVTFASCFDQITCTNAKPFKLKGGLPLGGFYSGTGVNSLTGIFDPAVAGSGMHVITYSYTNTYSCSSVASQNINNLSAVPFACGNILTDFRDNNTYPTVKIGTQCWMQTNLDFGATISDLFLQTDNCLAEKYLRNSKFVNQYSIFYQWDELMRYTTAESAQGLCPPGWHVPSSAEWEQLLSATEGPGLAGGTLQDMFLTNGFQSEQHGIFYMNKIWAFIAGPTAGSMYWTSTPSGVTRAVARGINEFNLSVSRYDGARGNAFSVRCLQDY